MHFVDPSARIGLLEARLATVERELANLRAHTLATQAAAANTQVAARVSPTTKETSSDEQQQLLEKRDSDESEDEEPADCGPVGQGEYQVSESVWDCAAFIGVDCLGGGVSAVLTVLTLLNVVIQLTFCHIVIVWMMDDPFGPEELDDYLQFRAASAHHVKFADHETFESMASQICQESSPLPWASGQIQKHSAIGEVLGPMRDAWGYRELSMLAILLWLATMLQELRETYTFFRGIASIPRGRRTRIAAAPAADGADKAPCFCSLSVVRFAMVVLLVVVPRLTVAGLLVYSGTVYLTYSASMGALLLNAMALAFVKDVDELLFVTFAPRQLKELQSTLKPLSVSYGDFTQRFPSAHSWGLLALIVVVLGVVNQIMLEPFIGRASLANEMMCDGVRNFIFSQNPATGIVEATPTFPAGNKERDLNNFATVLNLAQVHPPDAYGWEMDPQLRALLGGERTAVIVKGPGKAREALGSGVSAESLVHGDLVDFEPDAHSFTYVDLLATEGVRNGIQLIPCTDGAAAQTFTVFLDRMTKLFGHIFANSTTPRAVCNLVKGHCSQMGMTQLRALCPKTCGCHWWTAPQAAFFAEQRWGCPPACKSYTTSVRKAWPLVFHVKDNCTDVHPAAFLAEATDSTLADYIQGFLSFASSTPSAVSTIEANVGVLVQFMAYPSEVSQNFSSRAADLAAHFASDDFADAVVHGKWDLFPGHAHPRQFTGCQFWTSWEVSAIFQTDLCDASGEFRSIRTACPTSCSCRDGMKECPFRCDAV